MYGAWRNSPNPLWIQDDEISRLIALLDVSNENMHTATRELMHLIDAHNAGLINIAFLRLELQETVLPLAAESIYHLQALSNRYESSVQQTKSIGEFDGQDNPLGNIHATRLFEVQRYISLSYHMFSSAPMIISADFWYSLSNAH